MNRRQVASIGIVGIGILFAAGGFSYEIYNGVTSVSLPPLIVASWVFFGLAVSATEFGEIKQGLTKAPWWRKSTAFIYDVTLLFGLLFIPDTFVCLVSTLGRLPPPWLVRESASANTAIVIIVSLACFALFWVGLGLALHPRVRTPGMILCNIDIRIENRTSMPKMAFFGGFAYYGVFIPFFNIFSRGIKASGTVYGA